MSGANGRSTGPLILTPSALRASKDRVIATVVDADIIVCLPDNHPLTEANIRELGRVDVLMMPIDSEYHILKQREIEAIRRALRPRVLIPMHYRHPDLEPSPDEPRDLGPIDPWLEGQESVERLDGHRADFSAASLPPDERIVVFHHSPEVRPPRP